jgi:SAM-dependent methyltransferase
MDSIFLEALVCPNCLLNEKENRLQREDGVLRCVECHTGFNFEEGVIDLCKMTQDYKSVVSRTKILEDVNLIDFFMCDLLDDINGLVLDIGAGSRYRNQLAPYRQNLKSKQYYALDIVHNPDLDALANAEILPFGSKSVDVIICLEVLEHTSNPQRVANEFSRVLKEDGAILVSCPFLHGFHGRIDNYRFTWLGLATLFSDFAHLYIEPTSTWIETKLKCVNPLFYSRIFNNFYQLLSAVINPLARNISPMSWRQTSGHRLIASNKEIPELDSLESKLLPKS